MSWYIPAVGETVRVRSWESMATDDDFIVVGDDLQDRSNVHFTDAMRRFCGMEFVVQTVKYHPDREGRWDVSDQVSQTGQLWVPMSGRFCGYFMTHYMVEPTGDIAEAIDVMDIDEIL